jgi:hypothetical protein
MDWDPLFLTGLPEIGFLMFIFHQKMEAGPDSGMFRAFFSLRQWTVSKIKFLVMDASFLGQGTVSGIWEHSNATSVSIKGGEIHD